MMKHSLTALVIILLLVLMSVFFIAPVSGATKHWTIFVYVDGDNSLSEYVDYDLNEIWTVGSDTNINIIVYVDYKDRPTRIWYMNQKPNANTLIPTSQVGIDDEPNSADSDTLYRLMDYVYENYPSTYFGVIVWNHGTAWGGYNADDTSDDITDLQEMKNSFARFYEKHNKYIDLLGFDQCLMQTVSVIYNVKNYVNYVVASEEKEPAYGWEYTYPLSQLKASPSLSPENLGKRIIDGYDIHYQGNRDYTLSLIQITEFEKLIHDLNYYSQMLEHNAGTEWNNIKKAVMNSEKFVAYADLVLYDVYDFTEQLEMRISNTTIINTGITIRSSINNTVLYEKHGSRRGDATGLSWYMTKNQGSYNELYKYNYWCDDNTHDEFLETYIIKKDATANEPLMPTMELVGNTLYINNSVPVNDQCGSEVQVIRGQWIKGTKTYTSSQNGIFYARTWNGTDYSQVNSSTFNGVTRVITEYSGTDYTLFFKKGWNMFGLPLAADVSAQSFLAELDGGIEVVKRTSENTWVIFLNEKSSPSDNFDLELGEGYYLYADKDTLYTFEGLTTTHTLTLAKDWSFVSYSGQETTASSFAQLVDGQNTLTYRNPITDRYNSFIEAKTMGEDFTIERGGAFFIWDDDGESVTI